MPGELDELRDTVTRMEGALDAAPGELASELLAAYRALVPRFAADLADEREQLLSRGAALMLVEETLAARGRSQAHRV